jgi:hypothetical protein
LFSVITRLTEKEKISPPYYAINSTPRKVVVTTHFTVTVLPLLTNTTHNKPSGCGASVALAVGKKFAVCGCPPKIAIYAICSFPE